MMVGRSQELTDAIVNTSSQLAETIATRAEEVNSTLKASGKSIILDLNLRGGDVAKKLEQAGSRIAEDLISRSNKVTETLRDSADHVAEVVAARGDEMKELLSTRLAAFEDMIEPFRHRTWREDFARLLDARQSDHPASRRIRPHGEDLRLGTRRTARRADARRFGSMRGYVDTFDNRVTSKATEVTSSLDQRLAHFQETLDSRTQTLTEALSTRMMDIAKTLTEGGKEVVGAVDKRIADVTTIIDARSAKSPRPSASGRRKSTKRSARRRCGSPTRSTAASGILKISWSGALKRWCSRSRPAAAPRPISSTPGSRSFPIDQDQFRECRTIARAACCQDRRRARQECGGERGGDRSAQS